MQIVKYPNKILRQKLPIFHDFQIPNLKKFVSDMTSLMLKEDGIGLAGNQVNSDIRVIIVNTSKGPMEFFNPRIIKKSIIKTSTEEGCLSFPKIYGMVRRPKSIMLEYEDINGTTKTIKATGLMSVVFQHETDHVNGILFIDKIRKFKSGEEKLKELKKIAKQDEK